MAGLHTFNHPAPASRDESIRQSLRLGVSHCLLGAEVRYDGGHKRDSFLNDVLSHYVEWIPVCPEVEAGFGTPREAMRLTGSPSQPRLLTIKSKKDVTETMESFSGRRVKELGELNLSGFVFKARSPSCGLERVRVFNKHGMPVSKGMGLFSRFFIRQFPLLPVEEEGRLTDPKLRENFIERIFCYHRWQDLFNQRLTRGSVVHFHTVHKLLLLAHSRPHYEQLGRLIANAKLYRPTDLAGRYGPLFMEALKTKTTIRKHVNVIQHIVGYLKTHLTAPEKKELQEVILDYHHGLVPLVVPLTLIKHYVHLFHIPYIQNQIYLHPHPKELMLRNRV